ncbi:MAG: hypothetical protein JXK93_13735 [Sphaerochaetaceae bacterium]|nr:hypothetical protein [Sphaerochaetaceae bacterium]
MKIVYGCNGEGRGHAARTAALWPLLRVHHDITVWAPESIGSFLHEKCSGIQTRTIPGLHFAHNGHRILYLETVKKNLPVIGNHRRIVTDLAREMKEHGVQGVISDYEPLTAMAAVKAGIPLINLNHPAVVLRTASLRMDAISAKIVSSIMSPPAQKNLICSFYDGDVGPILREEVRNAVPSRGDYVLVYVKPSSSDAVKNVLKAFGDIEFRFFPDPERDFVQSLAGCRAIIAPAGHQLLSEALYLKKPVLAIPQEKQYEQRLNARMLKASGWGRGTDLSNLEKDLKKFLGELDSYPKKASPLYRFRTDDYTEVTAALIREFFESERQKEKPSKRVSSDFFTYVPEKIRYLRSLSA